MNAIPRRDRIASRFAELRRDNRAAFIPFITAGDPDAEISFRILERLPQAGADLIELGMPFSDPMADGPAVQASSLRALKAGMTTKRVIAMVERFRIRDDVTPIVLMGYFNPIHHFGIEPFIRDAARAGVDGLIIVDLSPEEDGELRAIAGENGVALVRLATPTTTEKRLDAVLNGAGGFLYYVSVTGVTGTKSVATDAVREAVARIRRKTDLPCAVGFGIRTPEQAAEIARVADAAVVGSAIVQAVAAPFIDGRPPSEIVDSVLKLCGSLAQAVHNARVT